MTKFEIFEEMYARLWTLIYDILAKFGINLDNGIAK